MMKIKEKVKNIYEKNYKLLLIIPAVILIFCFLSLLLFYFNNGEFFNKDISLTGGTSITIYDKVDKEKLEQDLSYKLGEISTREIYDLLTKEKKALIIETKTSPEEAKDILEEYLGYELNSENSSFEFTGSSLSENFYKQLIFAFIFAFIFMSIVVFIIFRTFVPSFAVIISAFTDIFMTLSVINLLGIKLSSAGIIAFLMLIGYSVDTDILLTTRLLKRKNEGNLNSRVLSSLKTGFTMTLTSLSVLLISLLIVKNFSIVLTQIFTVLSIGLAFDLLNTWITNVSILKWYLKNKE
jgi:preprotein translocase subunit SecF